MGKSIGILGGMGPLATADLFRKIVLMTKASCDNDHIRIFIDNNPAIADRTAAILSGGESPLPEMLSAPHYFLPELQKLTRVPFISMLAATARTCAAQHPGRCAAILATKGTLRTGLYSQALAREGVRCMVPTSAEQDVLMHLIYDVVKAARPLAPEQETWQTLLQGLRARGADYFILGCTELPIVAQELPSCESFVDPTAELAKAAIRFCGYQLAE